MNAARELQRKRLFDEYDSVAMWCAKRGKKGLPGDALPILISADCLDEINADTDAFERRVNECAYALAMEKHNFPADMD